MATNTNFKLLLAAEFTPGSPGGDWFHIKQLLRTFDWSRLSWWSMFGEAKDTTNLGDRLASCGLPGRMVPQRRFLPAKRFIMQSLAARQAAAHLREFIRQQKPDLLWLMAHDWTIPVFHRLVPRLGIPWHISCRRAALAARCRDLDRPSRRHVRMAEELYAGRQAGASSVSRWRRNSSGERGSGPSSWSAAPWRPEALEKLRAPRAKVPDAAPRAIRIGYAGTINAEDAFVLFVQALQRIRGELPVPVEVHMFA